MGGGTVLSGMGRISDFAEIEVPMRRSLGFLILMLALVFGAAAVDAAESVKTRAAEHERYGRIALDFQAPVEYEAKIEGATLRVHFARAIETDLGAIAKYLDAYLENASLDADGTTLTATLKRPATLKTFTDGNTVAIDLVTDRPAAIAGNSESTKIALQLRSAEHKGYHRLVFDWRRQVGYTVADAPDAVRVHFERQSSIDLARVAQALPGTSPEVADEDGGTTLTLHLATGEQVKHFRSGTGIVVDIYAATASVASTAAAKTAAAKPTKQPIAKANAPLEVVPPIELIEPAAGAGETVPLPQPGDSSTDAS
ncbi:MAG TPA: hypothetical protein VK433_10115, partial [Stellaceae bacterium]|nr:hypothetical protein [Stellaceae bacterium]